MDLYFQLDLVGPDLYFLEVLYYLVDLKYPEVLGFLEDLVGLDL